MSLVNNLTAFLGPERVSARLADLEYASHDESSCSPSMPDAVVWPLTTEEVVRVVRFAYEQNVPLTARGAGSSLEGNPIPVREGREMEILPFLFSRCLPQLLHGEYESWQDRTTSQCSGVVQHFYRLVRAVDVHPFRQGID